MGPLKQLVSECFPIDGDHRGEHFSEHFLIEVDIYEYPSDGEVKTFKPKYAKSPLTVDDVLFTGTRIAFEKMLTDAVKQHPAAKGRDFWFSKIVTEPYPEWNFSGQERSVRSPSLKELWFYFAFEPKDKVFTTDESIQSMFLHFSFK